MAQPIACDICTTEQAVQMLTNLQDGTVLALGPACLPDFYGHSVLAVMDAGEHKGPANKCQACRRVHERMTTPPAPADVQPAAPETPGDDVSTGGLVSDLAAAYAADDDDQHRPAPSPEAGGQ